MNTQLITAVKNGDLKEIQEALNEMKKEMATLMGEALLEAVAHKDEDGNRVESKYKYSKNNGILTLETAKIAPLYAGEDNDWDLVKQ